MKTRKCTTKTLARMREGYRRMPFWKKAEKAIAARLRLEGIPCQLVASQGRPWDILTESGKRIECKAARLLRGRVQHRRDRRKPKVQSPFWQVSIVRHGRLDESGVDYYVCFLTGCRDLRPVYLVIKAPLRRKHLTITLRQLLVQWASSVNAWKLVREGEQCKRAAED